MQQAIVTREPQPAPYRAEDIHATSFPGGNIRSVDMNTALQGMPQWLTNTVHPTGSQGSVASTATSTIPSAQHMYAGLQDHQGLRLDDAPQNLAMFHSATHPTTAASGSTASGPATTQVKAKKPYAGKRKGDHIDENDLEKKKRAKQPTYR